MSSMKLVICLILTCLLFAQELYAQDKTSSLNSVNANIKQSLRKERDSMLGKDKIAHAMASAYLAAVGYYLAREEASWSHERSLGFAVGFSLSFGVSKEIYDKYDINGTSSWRDMVANVCGIALGLLIISGSK